MLDQINFEMQSLETIVKQRLCIETTDRRWR